jgi:hypothetical protein
MTPGEAAPHLSEIVQNNNFVYLVLTPEVPDFTVGDEFVLSVFVPNKRLDININPQNIRETIGILDLSIFDGTQIKSILAWNIKPIFSYFTYYCQSTYKILNQLLDIRVLERFLGYFDELPPKNITEALNRSKRIVENPSWKQVYSQLHLPLIFKTLPRLESISLHHKSDLTGKFAYYDIEGQKNGRLRNSGKFKRSYVPHTLGNEQKEQLRPKSVDDVFMLADVNNCEVTVLQYLSKDQKLAEFLTSGKDVYVQIYELITGDVCDNDSKRGFCKLIFLPVIYGCGVKRLSSAINVDEDTAKDLIKRVHHYFKESIDWILEKENEAKTKGCVKDYFGRLRYFTEDNYYTARNFVVQSPAATVCLEKLVMLDDVCKNNARVVFTIHDGYGFTCSINKAKETFLATKKVIQTESQLLPGLKLEMHAEFGKKLNKLHSFWN